MSIRMPYVIVGIALNESEIQEAIDAVTRINVGQLRAGGIPRIYESGVVYEREAKGPPMPGVERFQTARDVHLLGHGDCDGLAPWRAAECIVDGDRRARAVVVPSSVGYHVIVRRGDGTTEDPSAELGMLDGVGLLESTPIVGASLRRKRMVRELRDKARSMMRRAESLTRTNPAGAGRLAEEAARMLRQARSMESRGAGRVPTAEDIEQEENTADD